MIQGIQGASSLVLDSNENNCYHKTANFLFSGGIVMRAGCLCLFEDELYANFLPLTYIRPVFDLRCGIQLIREKLTKRFAEEPTVLFCRRELENSMKEKAGYAVNRIEGGASALFVNGRALFNEPISPEGDQEAGVRGSTVVYARLTGQNARHVTPEMCLDGEFLSYIEELGIRIIKCETRCIEYPWNLVEFNGSQIEHDYREYGQSGSEVYEGAHLLNRERISIGKGSVIKPGAVIDAGNGPVRIDEDVTVYPLSFIEGPAYIGRGSLIKAGAKIYGGTSIGEVCKVGGEVEKSIIHSYSNKQHDGYIGLSYVGSWCNLGAGTSTSDLKNNYGTIRMRIRNKVVDTGCMFLGAVIGDHTKTGINTILNTGSVIGIMVNIFGSHLPPKYIPSFCWASEAGLKEYRFDKAVEVANRVMMRRAKEVTPALAKLFETIYTQTEKERQTG